MTAQATGADADAAQQRAAGLTPSKHTDGPYSPQEVGNANRNSGLPLEALRYDVTPIGLHYLLIHYDVPAANADNWRVAVRGAVRSPLELSLDAIRKLPARTQRVTLECAGNGRSLFTPRRQSMPWGEGGVGTAEWTGTPLRHVLEQAGLAADAVEFVFGGTDAGVDRGQVMPYERSLTIAQAMDDDVMLVWAMNGAPLLPQHGYPLRLIVPGWYGMASVKWLDRIEAVTTPFQGYQQRGTYIFRKSADDPGIPCTHMRIKSMMAPPGLPVWYWRSRLVERGAVEISGRAWVGGGGTIAKVAFGCNGVWQDATLDPPVAGAPYAWRRWHTIWNAEPGEHVLSCRATDADGNSQPDTPAWDIGGFGNNAIQRVNVTVR